MKNKSSLKLAFSIFAIANLLFLTACGGNSNSLTSETTDSEIAASKIGLDGEFDQSGLAKRVAAAIEEIPNYDQIAQVYVAQTGDNIILKGNVSSQDVLDQIIAKTKQVQGVGSINVDGITLQ